MTGMALLSFWVIASCRTLPFGPTVQKAIDFITSTPPDKELAAGNNGRYSHPIRAYALCEAFHDEKIQTQGIRQTVN